MPARPDARELAAVFAGGFIGAIVRSALSQELHASPGQWPWGTFAVNLAGALLLGLVMAEQRRGRSLYRRRFLASGLCGALTTFSTMMLELVEMVRHGHGALGAGYAAASVGCGLAAVCVGTWAVGRRRRTR